MDLIVLMVLALYAWQGFEQGIFVIAAEVLAWLSGWGVAALFTNRLAMVLIVYFGLPRTAAEVLAFMVIIGVVAQVVFRSLLRLVVRIPRQFFPTWWQGLLGLIPALINGVLVVGFIVLLILKIPFFSMVHMAIRASWFYIRILSWVQTWLIHW